MGALLDELSRMASIRAGKHENNSSTTRGIKQQHHRRCAFDTPLASPTKTRTSRLTLDQVQLIEDILTDAFIDNVRS